MERTGQFEMTTPLISTAGDARTLSLATHAEHPRRHILPVNVYVNRSRPWHRLLLLAFGILLSMLLLAWLVSHVIREWQQQPSYRFWMVFGLMSYASVFILQRYWVDMPACGEHIRDTG